MTQRHKIQLFEDKKVRTAWDDEREEWYFSIVDVCAVLSESENPQTYWRVLKNRLKKEGNETVTNCNALKMLAPDGKMRLTDEESGGQELLYTIYSLTFAQTNRVSFICSKRNQRHLMKGSMTYRYLFIMEVPLQQVILLLNWFLIN